jgi:hypothetical protein
VACVREVSVDSCERLLTSFLYSQKQYALFQEFVHDIYVIYAR